MIEMDLEKEFQKLVMSSFQTLRNDYYYRRYSQEEAEHLQHLLEERLGMSDPEGDIPEEAWRHSNWCSGG
jgi:hypothetical protein